MILIVFIKFIYTYVIPFDNGRYHSECIASKRNSQLIKWHFHGHLSDQMIDDRCQITWFPPPWKKNIKIIQQLLHWKFNKTSPQDKDFRKKTDSITLHGAGRTSTAKECSTLRPSCFDWTTSCNTQTLLTCSYGINLCKLDNIQHTPTRNGTNNSLVVGSYSE